MRVAAFDFPFGIPDALLRDEQFALGAGHGNDAQQRSKRENAHPRREESPAAVTVGQRAGYYARAGGAAVDAIVMRRALNS